MLTFCVYDAAQSIILPRGATWTGRDQEIYDHVCRRVLECASGEPVREEDVARYEDNMARVKESRDGDDALGEEAVVRRLSPEQIRGLIRTEAGGAGS